jgi:hypothetical protein
MKLVKLKMCGSDRRSAKPCEQIGRSLTSFGIIMRIQLHLIPRICELVLRQIQLISVIGPPQDTVTL